MKKKSKIVLILAVIALIIFISGSVYTYAKYFTKTIGTMGSKIKNWDILVNDETIRGKKTLTNQITATFPNLDGHIKENKIAPGAEGYFNITIDYSHVDLNFSYDLSIAENDTIPDIKLTRILVDNAELPASHIYVDGNGVTHITDDITIDHVTTQKEIQVYVQWYDESDNIMDNEEDTDVGINSDDIEFDIQMSFVQLND